MSWNLRSTRQSMRACERRTRLLRSRLSGPAGDVHRPDTVGAFLVVEDVESIRPAQRSGLLVPGTDAIGGAAAFDRVDLAAIAGVRRQQDLGLHLDATRGSQRSKKGGKDTQPDISQKTHNHTQRER